ncbi:YibE/F family protein [Patescibacteria group bacterium]|nr:YibE/F family protein [Patescibacteria group bacterium]
MKSFLFSLLVLATCIPTSVLAAEPSFADSVMRARVLSVESAGERAVAGTDLSEAFQRLSVEVIEGAQKGEILEVENNAPTALSVGDVFYLHKVSDEFGTQYAVGEPDRRWVLFGLAGLFVLVTVVAAGKAGALSLLSLVLSFLIIIYGLVPALSSGGDPVLISVFFAIVMLAVAMIMTHGLNRAMWVALAGSIVALVFAAVVAHIAVALANLSGFASDETVFLNFATDGAINLPALLLGGILVGIVGILNDVSVSQVHTVIEISDANPALTKKEVLTRAMRVGQEHMGAVVNTLPLAYAGASLPLLLLFFGSDASPLFILNREIFAVELIRTFAGGIGLMCSGVIATLLAVMFTGPARHRDRIAI